MKNNDTFDILKYILSFMIIAIHTGGGVCAGAISVVTNCSTVIFYDLSVLAFF